MTDEEKLEKIREKANEVIYAWHKMEIVAHHDQCYLIHPACAAQAIIAILDEGKYGINVE